MPLSDSELKALKADAKRKVVSAGDSLFVVVESVGKGGGKSFIGRTRFPPGSSGKQVEVRIGPYGRGAGKWTLKAAQFRCQQGADQRPCFEQGSQQVKPKFTNSGLRSGLKYQVRLAGCWVMY